MKRDRIVMNGSENRNFHCRFHCLMMKVDGQGRGSLDHMVAVTTRRSCRSGLQHDAGAAAGHLIRLGLAKPGASWYSMVLVMATTEGITASTMGDTSPMNTPPEEVEVDWGAAWTTWVCWIGAVSSGNKALAARLTPNMVPPDTTPKRRAAAVTMAVVFITERFFGALWLLPFSPWPPPFIPPFPSCPP